MNQTVPIYNMAFVLEEVAKLLDNELRVALNYVKSVRILTMNEAASLLNIEQIPGILVMPIGETHTMGPAALTARQTYIVKLMIVARSVDPNKYRTKLADKNIFDLTQKIRELLYKNKRFDKKLFEMKDTFAIRDVDVLSTIKDGIFNAREITIEYTSLEGYTSFANPQTQLELPQAIDPAIISF